MASDCLCSGACGKTICPTSTLTRASTIILSGKTSSTWLRSCMRLSSPLWVKDLQPNHAPAADRSQAHLRTPRATQSAVRGPRAPRHVRALLLPRCFFSRSVLSKTKPRFGKRGPVSLLRTGLTEGRRLSLFFGTHDLPARRRKSGITPRGAAPHHPSPRLRSREFQQLDRLEVVAPAANALVGVQLHEGRR